MIEIKQLEIGYRSKRKQTSVFKGLNASFQSGSLIGLIGDNGVGKSTLLKTLTGYLKPLHGSVLIQGENLESLSFEQKASLISIVTTEKIGGFNLTVYDVVALGRTPYLSMFGKLMPDDIAIIQRSLERLGLASLKDTLMEELSDGQRQKVMIEI